MEELKYPIGKLQIPEVINIEQIKEWIATIEAFPRKLRQEIEDLNDEELEKRYREGGWTIRQVIHHCADAHLMSFARFKLTLTEHTPIVNAYEETLWAALPDAKEERVESSLQLIEGLHARWASLLNTMSDDDFEKVFFHPVNKQLLSLKVNLAIYSWHCEHHLAHIKLAKQH